MEVPQHLHTYSKTEAQQYSEEAFEHVLDLLLLAALLEYDPCPLNAVCWVEQLRTDLYEHARL